MAASEFLDSPLLIAGILTIFWLLVARTKLHNIYRRQFGELVANACFWPPSVSSQRVAVVRGITIAIHNDFGPFHNVMMNGRHIHHLVWGILLLLLIGYLWLLQIGTGSDFSARLPGGITSLLYGVAAALILDEFALWLNLSDVYWQRQGRESYEAMALFGGILAVGIFGKPFFTAAVRELTRPFRRPSSR